MEALPTLRDGYEIESVSELNLKDANISTIIWATGYSFNFSMVRLPIFDGDGYPIQKRGITGHPGLYFVGLPWLHNAKSGLLFGTAQDADHIASAIRRRCASASASSRVRKIQSARAESYPDFARGVGLITSDTR